MAFKRSCFQSSQSCEPATPSSFRNHFIYLLSRKRAEDNWRELLLLSFHLLGPGGQTHLVTGTFEPVSWWERTLVFRNVLKAWNQVAELQSLVSVVVCVTLVTHHILEGSLSKYGRYLWPQDCHSYRPRYKVRPIHFKNQPLKHTFPSKKKKSQVCKQHA